MKCAADERGFTRINIRFDRFPAQRGAALVLLCLVSICSGSPAPLQVSGPLAAIESAYQEARFFKDQIDITSSRQAGRSLRGASRGELLASYREARAMLQALLAADTAALPTAEDRRAHDIILRVFRDELVENPEPAGLSGGPDKRDCAYDPALLAAGTDGLSALTRRMYGCFGRAAQNVLVDGQTLDRLTVLGKLAREENAEIRKKLFLSLAAVWQSVNRDGGASSPYRMLLRLRAESWRGSSSPIDAKAGEFGIDPETMEDWLTSILNEWRRITPDRMVEPWDFYYENGKASRILSPSIPLQRLRTLVDRYYQSLGADPAELGVHYDLLPRQGKDPVAFTTFGARNRYRDGGWLQGEFWVSAAYRIGGLDNLAELMHEAGHGIHIAAIRTRPAFEDWPDSDTFTEALADFTGLEVYEPAWQKEHLGISAPLADSIRNKYGAVVLDVAWALFEMRLHRNPDQDPNRVWIAITRDYLRIIPHPELSWWAMRGQLINAPFYMLNYALGSVIAADLRAKARELRGGKVFAQGDPGWYSWLSERIYRFGLERSSAQVMEDFLGRPTSPRALLEDMSRALSGTPGPPGRGNEGPQMHAD